MLFIASDTTHYVSATSYLSLADATDIMSASDDHATWDSKSDGVKKIILNQASLAVDSMLSYKGKKTDKDQLLKFPRDDAKTIPTGVKLAVCTLALKFAGGDAFTNSGEVQSEKIGKLAITYFQPQGGQSEVEDSGVLTYLRGLELRQLRINQ